MTNSTYFSDQSSAERVAQDMNITAGKTAYGVIKRNKGWLIVELKDLRQSGYKKTGIQKEADEILKERIQQEKIKAQAGKEVIESNKKDSFTVKANLYTVSDLQDYMREKGITANIEQTPAGNWKISGKDSFGNKAKWTKEEIEGLPEEIAGRRMKIDKEAMEKQERNVKENKAKQESLDEAKRRAEAPIIAKQIEERAKKYKVAEGVSMNSSKEAEEYARVLKENGYAANRMAGMDGKIRVTAINPTTGQPIELSQEQIQAMVTKYRATHAGYGQMVKKERGEMERKIKENLTPGKIVTRTAGLAAKTVKDEVPKTLKVTSEHANVVTSMSRSIPTTRGNHPKITGTDDEGRMRQPKIMSSGFGGSITDTQTPGEGSRGFAVQSGFVINPRSRGRSKRMIQQNLEERKAESKNPYDDMDRPKSGEEE
jgi:hypothetical protein